MSAEVAYRVRPARHWSAVTPAWASHAVVKPVLTVRTSASAGGASAADAEVAPLGPAASGSSSVPSSPPDGSTLIWWLGSSAGAIGGDVLAPETPRNTETTRTRNTVSASAIPYRVFRSRRTGRMAPHPDRFADSGRLVDDVEARDRSDSGR
jgi:hypothetical protein